MLSERCMNKSENGIDGFDIGIIMGVNKCKSLYDVYLDKINCDKEMIKHDNIRAASKESQYWDNTFKEIIAKEFSIRSGKKVRKENKTLRDQDYEFMIGSADRKIVGENSILMCKSANSFLPREWNGEELPASYVLQAQHYMKIYNADKCYIASLIAGEKFVYKEILRDETVIDMIIEVEKDFWLNNILKKVPPKVASNKC